MKYHVIQPDGTVTTDEALGSLRPGQERDILGGAGEHVSVLFNGKVVSMIVNGEGAVMDPPLAPNTRATAIYWCATIMGHTGVSHDPLTAPMIHGPAILYEGKLP